MHDRNELRNKNEAKKKRNLQQSRVADQERKSSVRYSRRKVTTTPAHSIGAGNVGEGVFMGENKYHFAESAGRKCFFMGG